MKMTGVLVVPLRVFSLKRFSAEAFAGPFRVLSRKNMTGDNELFKDWYTKYHKVRSWYLLGVLFKISDEQRRPFLSESSSPQNRENYQLSH